MKVLSRALSYAIEERASFVDATLGCDGSSKNAHDQAKRFIKEFEALHQKLFGRKTQYQQFRDQDAATPTISIQELSQQYEKKDI